MNKLIRLFLTASTLLLATIAYSQSPNPLYQHLPPSANHIYSIRLGQVIAKGELAGLLGSIPMKDPNTAKIFAIVKDPASAGVDLNYEILVAETIATGIGADTLSFTQILVPLTDTAKFRTTFANVMERGLHIYRLPGKGAPTYGGMAGVAWNAQLLVFTRVTGVSSNLNPASPGLSGKLADEKSLATLTGFSGTPWLTDQRFLTGFASDEDVHAWIFKMSLTPFMSKFIKQMKAMDTTMGGNALSEDYLGHWNQTPHPPSLMTFNFEKGRIVLRMTTYNTPEDAALLQRVFDQPLNKDLLARVPGEPLLGFSAVHFNPAALPDFLDKHHTLQMINSVLGKEGLSVNDLSAVFGGDILFAAVGDTTAITDTTKKKVKMYFVATLGDPTKLMQLTAKLAAAGNASTDTAKAARMKKLADKMMIRDNLLVISGSHEMAQKYFDNSTRRPTDLLDGKRMQYAMVDLKAASALVTATMSNNPKALMAARILEKLDKIEIGSSLTDGNTVVTFQIVTGDPSTNSLKTLVGLLH